MFELVGHVCFWTQVKSYSSVRDGCRFRLYDDAVFNFNFEKKEHVGAFGIAIGV